MIENIYKKSFSFLIKYFINLLLNKKDKKKKYKK